jgi:nitronate monooxygenase
VIQLHVVKRIGQDFRAPDEARLKVSQKEQVHRAEQETRYAQREPHFSHALQERVFSDDDTVRTRVFDVVRGYPWPREFPGRALRNTFVERWQGREDDLITRLENEQSAYQNAARTGDTDVAVVWAGEAIDLITSIESAATLISRISSEAEAQIRNVAGTVK